jgi:hypothetical protein
MPTSTKSVDCPPIWKPKLAPSSWTKAGALHPPVRVRQVATPCPYSPPKTKAPFLNDATTKTHVALAATSRGIPLIRRIHKFMQDSVCGGDSCVYLRVLGEGQRAQTGRYQSSCKKRSHVPCSPSVESLMPTLRRRQSHAHFVLSRSAITWLQTLHNRHEEPR